MAFDLVRLASPYWAVLLLLFGIIIKRRYSTSIRDIPGPFLASFSTLWQVHQLWKGHMEAEMIRLHRQYGHYVRISEKEVSVSHPDAVKLLLHAPIPKTSWYTIFSLPDYTFVNQMSECNPQEHIRKGRNVAAGYALSNIIKSEPHVDNLIRLLLARIGEDIEQARPVELDKWLTFFAFDVVGEVTFSQAFSFLETASDVRSAISTNRFLALYVAVVGHYVWFHHATLGHPMLSRLGIQPTSHVFDTCLAAVDRRRKNPDVRKDMMAQGEGYRRQNPDRMTNNEVLAAAVANVGAGGDTTSATLQCLVYHLIRNPMHLQRLQEELDLFQNQGKLSDIISYSEAQNLPYLQACIKETYRYHPAVGTGLGRVVPEGGISIGSRYFPPGTVLSVNAWVIHRSTSIFGQDAGLFNPERWLDAERAKGMSSYLIHWGAGYNQCPGRNLAHFELSKLGAQLFRGYEIELLEPEKEWCFENRFTYVPYNWPCRLKIRHFRHGKE
ncbi:cytochrome P450 [Xylariales sp. PMI_506]|nr:cytochrome P450 [Xylariales sp. PMI_506]